MKNSNQLTHSIVSFADLLRNPVLRYFPYFLIRSSVSLFVWLAVVVSARAVCQQGCDSLSNTTFLGWEANTQQFENTAVGAWALTNIEFGGNNNTAIGSNTLALNQTGYGNTAVGAYALYSNSGNSNVATGADALTGNTSGSFNTASGSDALENNGTGNYNTATGYLALRGLFGGNVGSYNTATGVSALQLNAAGVNNVATGAYALERNNSGNYNTATGVATLDFNTSGSSNTADGYNALFSTTNGSFNTATGANALQNNTTGTNNVAVGGFALFSNTTANNNTAIGGNALFNSTGTSNIAVGPSAGVNLTTGNNNIDIGNKGVAGESNAIRIGTKQTHRSATYVAGISGTSIPTGIAVLVDANGHLGTTTSSARYKKNIRPMDKASEAIHSLQPAIFQYKEQMDPNGILQFGLIAEEVEKVSPTLVAYDDEGKPYSVRYEAVNAMLLNEFLKEHRKGEEQDRQIAAQGAIIAEQQKQLEVLIATVNEQAGQIRQVADEVALLRPARRLVMDQP